MHELMHSMGFEHEMSRYDRDNYLEIQWENIIVTQMHNFDKQPRPMSFPKYEIDLRSVMMYGLNFFAKVKDGTMPSINVLVSNSHEYLKMLLTDRAYITFTEKPKCGSSGRDRCFKKLDSHGH
jgi:Astacin (Peptidase family M12A)